MELGLIRRGLCTNLVCLSVALATFASHGATVTNLVVDSFGNLPDDQVTFAPQQGWLAYGNTNVVPTTVSVQMVSGAWSATFPAGGLYKAKQLGFETLMLVPTNEVTYSFAYCANLATNPIPTFTTNAIPVYYTLNSGITTNFAVITNVTLYITNGVIGRIQ